MPYISFLIIPSLTKKRLTKLIWLNISFHFYFFVTAQQMYGTKNPKQIFKKMKLHGLVPNFYIHVYVNAIQKNGRTDHGITNTRMQKLGTRPRSAWCTIMQDIIHRKTVNNYLKKYSRHLVWKQWLVRYLKKIYKLKCKLLIIDKTLYSTYLCWQFSLLWRWRGHWKLPFCVK
jgi:hypothetical protein